MRKIFGNKLFQTSVGLVISIIGSYIFYLLALAFLITGSGLPLFGFGIMPTEGSNLELIMALVFALMIILFPYMVWLLLSEKGSLKGESKVGRIITLILFATSPIWFVGLYTFLIGFFI